MGAKNEENRRKLVHLIQPQLALLEPLDPPEAVDDILAIVGAGYLAIATQPLPILGEPPLPPIAHDELAGNLVRSFRDGLHPVPPESKGYRGDYRAGIDVELDERPHVPGDTMIRDILAILAAGFWEEDKDTKMSRSLVGKRIATYYIEGLG